MTSVNILIQLIINTTHPVNLSISTNSNTSQKSTSYSLCNHDDNEDDKQDDDDDDAMQKLDRSLPDNKVSADDIVDMVRHAESSNARQLSLQQLLQERKHTQTHTVS